LNFIQKISASLEQRCEEKERDFVAVANLSATDKFSKGERSRAILVKRERKGGGESAMAKLSKEKATQEA
jgi:hypothetical protein